MSPLSAAPRSGSISSAPVRQWWKPHHFGLEHDDELSDRLRRRIVGKVEVAPEAMELTAAGGDVIESDKGFEMLSGLPHHGPRRGANGVNRRPVFAVLAWLPSSIDTTPRENNSPGGFLSEGKSSSTRY
jgi:hypothetical protein